MSGTHCLGLTAGEGLAEIDNFNNDVIVTPIILGVETVAYHWGRGGGGCQCASLC